MKGLKTVFGILLIIVGPLLICSISNEAFGKLGSNWDFGDALPWLLLATATIPVGMSIAVIGFLCLKGELDK